MAPFVMPHSLVLTLGLSTNASHVSTIKLKFNEDNFFCGVFLTLYKAGSTFESADEILKCSHANEIF